MTTIKPDHAAGTNLFENWMLQELIGEPACEGAREGETVCPTGESATAAVRCRHCGSTFLLGPRCLRFVKHATRRLERNRSFRRHGVLICGNCHHHAHRWVDLFQIITIGGTR